MDKLVTPGSKWVVVNMRWIEKWQNYTYFDLLNSDSKSDSISEE